MRADLVSLVLVGLAACGGTERERAGPKGAGGSGALEAGAGGALEAGAGGALEAGAGGAPTDAGRAASFRRIELESEFVAEGATFADVSGDGTADVVAGPWWFEGPSFEVRHDIRPAPWTVFPVRDYSDDFFSFARDLDGDGDLDVLKVGFPGRDATVWENPGSGVGTWLSHGVFFGVSTESPTWADLTGDGVPELVCAAEGALGWLTPGSDLAARWTFQALSPAVGFLPFTHGLGVGDVNGDGRADVLEATAWWEQPASLAGAPLWTRHAADFGQGGADMFAFDVDGDGDADVVATESAHAEGLSWFEQDRGAFVRRAIEPAVGGALALHEPHALAVADMNGDGLPDLVTGERFWGHAPPEDVPFEGPAHLYWFELHRDGEGAWFEPHLIDDDSGVGTQVHVSDATGDGRPDIVVANKRGIFVFLQE